MDKEFLFLKSILFGAVITILALIWMVLIQEGLGVLLASLWAFAGLLLILSLTSTVGWVSRTTGLVTVTLAAVMIIAIVLIQSNLIQKMFPVCGDNVCGRGECDSGCSDCSPGTCEDGICQVIENCDTSKDCECGSGAVCDIRREGIDEKGCYDIRCGDGFCDSPEDRYNCCTDCNCGAGYACDNNICFFQPPSITFTPYIISPQISAASLAANPTLTNSTGVPHPFVTMILKNRISTAYNMTVIFNVSNILSKKFFIGNVPPEREVPILWYIGHEPDLLKITEDIKTNVTVKVTYLDGQGVYNSPVWLYPLTITSRNTLDSYGHLAFFVTPNDVYLNINEPEKIWEEVGKRTDVIERRSLIQFPAETLEKGQGTSTDIGILLASMFFAAGHRTSLVESAQGLLVRIRMDKGYIMLDPALIEEDFKDAIVSRPGFAVHEIEKIWKERNSTVISLK